MGDWGKVIAIMLTIAVTAGGGLFWADGQFNRIEDQFTRIDARIGTLEVTLIDRIEDLEDNLVDRINKLEVDLSNRLTAVEGRLP